MCLLVLIFLLSVKGAKGPIGPIGDLGTKGVEVMSPCYVTKMCVCTVSLSWGTNLEKCVVWGVNRLFCLTGRFWRKRCSRRPGKSRRDGELLFLTEITLRVHLYYWYQYDLFFCLELKGERGSPGDKGPTGPKGKRVSLFVVAIVAYLYKTLQKSRVERWQ